MGTVKYTGPVASFHCPTNAEIRSLKVHFSPKQLGEGTPSPDNVREIVGWDGVTVQQSGKNLAIPIEPYLLPNVWADNNKVTTTGKGKIYSVYLPCKPNTTYTCSKSVESVVFVVCYTKELPQVGVPIYGRIQHNNQDLTITTSSDAKYLFLWFYNNVYGNEIYTYDKVLDTIQIEENTFVTPYEPYHGSTTNYAFGVLGKNKLNTTNITHNNYNFGGIPNTLSPNTIYAYSINGSPTYKYRLYLSTGDNAGTVALNSSYLSSGQSATFTTPSDTSNYPELVLAGNANGAGNEDFSALSAMIELGSSATSYEPYDPKHTVYGGWVDLISGEVCEEWGEYIFTGDEDIKVGSWNTGGYTDGQFFRITYSDDASGNPFCDTITGEETKCNILKPIASSYYGVKAGIISVLGKKDGVSYRYIVWGKSGFGDTVEDCVSKLRELYNNGTPLTIVSKLANPYINTYHIAPTSMQTFLGQNNVWSNADYVEVEYDLHETQTILARKQFIIANQPHIVKPAAAPLQNFVTDLAAPLNSCKVHFSPVQEGSGDPSPDNVRAISGWNDITLYTDKNKNLFDQSHLLELSGWTTTTNVTSPNGTTVYTGTIRSMYDSWKNHMPTDCAFKENTRYVVGLWWRRITPSTSNGMKFIIVYTDGTSTTATNQSNNTENFIINYLVSAANKTVDYIRLTYGTSTNVYVTGMFIQEYENFENSYPLPSVDKVEVSLPETVYGGYVDLVTGEVWKDWDYYTVDGSQDIGCDSGYMFYMRSPWLSNLGCVNSYDYTGLIMANSFQTITKHSNLNSYNGEYLVTGYASNSGGNWIYFKLTNDISGTDNVSIVKSYFAEHPLTVYFKLKTPILVTTLTPTQLKTLRGTNNIWASNGGDNLEIAYWKH